MTDVTEKFDYKHLRCATKNQLCDSAKFHNSSDVMNKLFGYHEQSFLKNMLIERQRFFGCHFKKLFLRHPTNLFHDIRNKFHDVEKTIFMTSQKNRS